MSIQNKSGINLCLQVSVWCPVASIELRYTDIYHDYLLAGRSNPGIARQRSVESPVYADTAYDTELNRPWPQGSGPFADRKSDGKNRLPFDFDYAHHPSSYRKTSITAEQRIAAAASWEAWNKKKFGAPPKSVFEDFPTAPWVYRALCEHILGGAQNLKNMRCLEPACGRMYSSDALWEYFGSVRSSDIGEYGFGARYNFLNKDYPGDSFDWVITNPPFSRWEDFALEALRVASRGVAFLGPLNMLCTLQRFNRLYQANPLSMVCGMVERIQIRDELVVEKSGQTLEYAWFIWMKQPDSKINFRFQVPPCREVLEQPADYIYRV
jgi:hypothetical protein